MSDTLIDNPTISIVMPTYNRAYCIEKTIQSVLNQTFEDWELIIVDNNSTDNSIEIIKNIDDNRISIYQVNNKGIIAKSRNLGIHHSNGTYIAFLDSDDLWTLDKLEKSLSTLQLGYDIVYHDLFIISKLPPVKNIFNMLSTRNLHQPVFNDLLLNGNALNNSSVVVRKKLIKDIHGFSEEKELVGSEDYDCWLRLSKNTNRFCRIDSSMGYYWDGGGNMTSPKRSISNALYLQSLYALELESNNIIYTDWMFYVLARSYYLIEKKNLSIKYCKLGIKSNLRPYLKLKLLITLVMIKINFK